MDEVNIRIRFNILYVLYLYTRHKFIQGRDRKYGATTCHVLSNSCIPTY